MPPNIPPDSLAPTEFDDQPPHVDDVASDQSLNASAARRGSSPSRPIDHRTHPPRENNTDRGGRFARDYDYRKKSMSDVKRPPPEDRHYEPDYRTRSPPRGDHRRFQREPHPQYAPRDYRQPIHEEQRGRPPVHDDRREFRSNHAEDNRRYNEPPPIHSGRISPGPPPRTDVRVADTYRPALEPRYRSPPRSPPHSFAQRPIERRDSLSSRLPREYSPPLDSRPRRSTALDDDRRRPLSPPPGRYTKDFTRGDVRPSERGRAREDSYAVPLEERINVRPPSLQERLNVGNSPAKPLGERLSAGSSTMNRSLTDRDRDPIPSRRLEEAASLETMPDRRSRPRSGSRGRTDIRDSGRASLNGAPTTRTRDFSPPTAADLARDKERAMRDRQRPAPPIRRPFSPPSAADIARDRERARDHQKRSSPARPSVYPRDDERDRRGSESGRGGYGMQTRYLPDRSRELEPPFVDPGYVRRSPGPAYPSRVRPRSPSPVTSVKRARDDAYAAAPYWEKDLGRGYDAAPPARNYGRLEGRPRSPVPLRPSASYDDLSRSRPAYPYDPLGRKSPPISYEASRPRSPGPLYERSRPRSPPSYQREDRRYVR